MRAWRWRQRRDLDRFEDRAPGGRPVHGLLDEEEAAIVALFEEWGEVGRSHRKLAHCGSDVGRVWVSPSTVKRVLAAQGLHLAARGEQAPQRRPFPKWVTYTRNSIWIYDTTHFSGCPTTSVTAVMDLVTRKWITGIVSAEETSTPGLGRVHRGPRSRGLLVLVEARADGLVDPAVDDDRRPILLAVSDNGLR